MLRITIHEEQTKRRIELAGKIAGPWVAELESVWQSATPCQHETELDLKDVTAIDEGGRDLLARFARAGVRLVGCGVAMTTLLDEICAEASSDKAAEGSSAKRKSCGGTRISRIAGLLGILLVLSSSLHAQPGAPPAMVRLTLHDAVNRALRENPQVAIANLNLAESQESRKIARAALLPSASLRASEDVVRGNIESLAGQQIPSFPHHYGPFWTTAAGPSFSAPLIDLTLWERWRASKEAVSASAEDRTTAREQNAQLVVSQYLSGLRASADLSAAESRVDLAKALLDLATDQQKSGVGTRIDTLRANVQYQNELQRYSEAQTQLAVSLYGLSRLLNLDPRQGVELADASSFFETPAYESSESLAAAYEQRPELRSILAQIRAAEGNKRAAAAERLPRLSVNGEWNLQGLTPNTMVPTYQYGVSLEVPLFTGGRIGAEKATADLEIRKLEQSEQDLKNQIAQEVKTALAQLQSARVQVGAANLGVSLAKEEVAQAQDRFRAGVATNIEVITGQDELSRANDNQIAALYSYNQSRADLALATGQMETLYSK